MEFEFKKSLGQNFLTDKNMIRKIVDVVNINEGINTLVIEVGPGAGAITEVLVNKANNVIAYEIDKRLSDKLGVLEQEHSNFKVIYGDFLDSNVNNDIENYKYDSLLFVSNLPYYITTPIITKIINDEIPVDKMILMMQKEVGDRLSAKPGNRDYGSLTVFLNYYFDIKKEFIVVKEAFVPKPKIDSVVVSLSMKKDRLELYNRDLFFKLVRDSFCFKRKTLRNNLKGYNFDIIEEVLSKYGFDLSVRAEQLSLEIYVDIANNLKE